jgi:hypothetical protein
MSEAKSGGLIASRRPANSFSHSGYNRRMTISPTAVRFDEHTM